MSQIINIADDGARYGSNVHERKKPPKGLILLSIDANKNDNIHNRGAHIEEAPMCFSFQVKTFYFAIASDNYLSRQIVVYSRH